MKGVGTGADRAENWPPEGARSPTDAVGHVVAVGDTVLAILGRNGARGVVTRVSADRAVVRRVSDGFVAVLATASLVVQPPLEQPS